MHNEQVTSVAANNVDRYGDIGAFFAIVCLGICLCFESNYCVIIFFLGNDTRNRKIFSVGYGFFQQKQKPIPLTDPHLMMELILDLLVNSYHDECDFILDIYGFM